MSDLTSLQVSSLATEITLAKNYASNSVNIASNVKSDVQNLKRQMESLNTTVVNTDPQNIVLGSYESGPYYKNGIEYLAGFQDYLTYVNMEEGGVNNLELFCNALENSYSSTKLVNLVKTKIYQNGGISVVSPLSTGSSYNLYDYSKQKKVPLLTMGYGNNKSVDGLSFPAAFNAAPTYFDEAGLFIKIHMDKFNGSFAGKKLVYLYHNSAYGKGPFPVYEKYAKTIVDYSLDSNNNLILSGANGPVSKSGGHTSGFEIHRLPVQHPGDKQTSQFELIKSLNPEGIMILAWGPMINATEKLLLHADYKQFMSKMYYGWWSFNPELREDDEQLKNVDPKEFEGLNVFVFNSLGVHGTDVDNTEILGKIKSSLYGSNYKYGYFKNSSGFSDADMLMTRAGSLYMRGVQNAYVIKKAVKKGHQLFKPTYDGVVTRTLTGSQMIDSLNTLEITQTEIDADGMKNNVQPIKMTSLDHKGCTGINVYKANSTGKFDRVHTFVSGETDVINKLLKAL
jgi:branched-chain amino acid transport system substrate-binding protein